MDEPTHSMVCHSDIFIPSRIFFFVLFSIQILDPNFKIHDTVTINFQMQTFAQDGLILWIEDPLPESSFTIEIQNRQVSVDISKE